MNPPTPAVHPPTAVARPDRHRPRRPPWVGDAALALLVAAGCAATMAGRSDLRGTRPDALAWFSVGLLVVPLLWRSRAPVATYWAVVGMAWVVDLAGVRTPGALFVPLVALYAVARHRPQRYLWPAAAAFEASLVANLVRDDLRWHDLVAANALMAATVLLGMYLRTRQGYLAGLAERARRLEREREQRARLTIARERTQIAREMHDIVAHNLAVMVALADGAAFTVESAPERAVAAMRQVSATGRQALGEMRRMVGLLRGDADAEDAGRTPQPGLADIDRLVDQVRAAGLRVVSSQAGVPGDWGPGAGLAVYRIVQEALTNVLKHAGSGASVEVCLRYADRGVEVEILDDGAGQPTRPDGAGRDGGAGGADRVADRHGLAGMRERAAPYGGRVEAGPRPSTGWRVYAELRFDAPATIGKGEVTG